MADSAQNMLIDSRILNAVSQHSGCDFEDLCRAWLNLTWNQVFLAVDRLKRRDQVQVLLDGRGRYLLALPGQLGEQKPERVSVHGPETTGLGSEHNQTVLTQDLNLDSRNRSRLSQAEPE